ncbi:MAG: [LysW]-aminoadipate/[LysW]-glutamate kinase [Candidatus Geothermarchaeales archaeon]
MIVIKIGGSILDRDLTPIARDLKGLWDGGEKIIIVHGGGRLVTETASRMGVEQKFITSVSGFRSRYTDEKTLNILKMVLAGLVNKDIVRLLVEWGVPAVGLSGVDGKIVEAERKRRLKIVDERGRKRFITADYSGKPSKINVELLKLLSDNGLVPVIASLGLGEKHEILNLDGDRVAAHIARSLGSDRLITLSDVDGVYINEKLVDWIPAEEAKRLLGEVERGMKKKLQACLEGLQMGLSEVIIASGLRVKPVTSALKHEHCTVVR